MGGPGRRYTRKRASWRAVTAGTDRARLWRRLRPPRGDAAQAINLCLSSGAARRRRSVEGGVEVKRKMKRTSRRGSETKRCRNESRQTRLPLLLLLQETARSPLMTAGGMDSGEFDRGVAQLRHAALAPPGGRSSNAAAVCLVVSVVAGYMDECAVGWWMLLLGVMYTAPRGTVVPVTFRTARSSSSSSKRRRGG